MYKLLLTLRYLRRKMIPIFALVAVTLCTAMVIIVISVMGGFLELVKSSGRTLMGDVSLYAGLGGFPHYKELADEIEAMPEVEATTSLVVAYGLIKIGQHTKGVQVYGIDGPSYDRVTKFRGTLMWNRELLSKYPSVAAVFGDTDPVDAGVALAIPGETELKTPTVVLGLEVSPYNRRLKDGSYDFPVPLPGSSYTVTLLPITTRGGVTEPSTERFTVVNEFKSGVYDVDSQRVYIPFDIAQQMMLMGAADLVDPDDPLRVLGTVPARTTEIHVRAVPGVTAEQLQQKVREVYARFAGKHEDLPPEPYMSIETWIGRQQHFLGAVENEKGLMTFLFGIISVVAILMIGLVFYMIVLEKTRDIGILRAIGASRVGVASIFLMFGTVIGTIGAAVGTLIAYLVVTYINEIHQWLGDTFGVVIWDRSVYFFDSIPNRVNWNEIAVIVTVAMLASILGALIPAGIAARVDAVESLRYE